MNETGTYPVVRLRPKANARRIRHGYPWVWADELVTDRRTKSLAPGRLARLEDAERNVLGVVAINSNSKIIGRVLDQRPDAVIDQAWFMDRLVRAVALRDKVFDMPFWRWVHAEADGLPGVIIDRFGDTAAIQPNAAWADRQIDALADAVVAQGVPNVVMNGTGRARKLEGLEDKIEVIRGRVSEPIKVAMNGATYIADLLGGQKTGLFYDQRPNHAFAAKLCKGAEVLDLFCHVGGFGLAALAGGAKSVVLADASSASLELALKGAAAMGVSDQVETRQGDAFDTLAALASTGRQFDVVISDPPAFAPNKAALQAGLRAYEKSARMAAKLVRPGGALVLCSCSHAANLEAFRAACVAGIGKAGRSSALVRTGFAGPDHPEMPMLPESGYLKALTFDIRT